ALLHKVNPRESGAVRLGSVARAARNTPGRRAAHDASRLAHLADQCLHEVQVPLQPTPALLREAVLGARDPAVEGLRAFHVPGLLELPGVHAQVAVRRTEELLQVVEGQRVVDGEGAHDAEADAFVDDAIQLDGVGARAAAGAGARHGAIDLLAAFRRGRLLARCSR